MAKKTTGTTMPTKHDEHLAFVKTVKLQAVGLDKAESTVNRSAWSSHKEGLLTSLNFELKLLNSDESSFVAGAYFHVTLHKANESPVAEIKMEFSALLLLDEPASEESLLRFCNSEAKLVFWPYMRNFVSDISNRMAIPTILIPLITEFGGQETKTK